MMKKKDISVDFGKIYLPDVFSKKEMSRTLVLLLLADLLKRIRTAKPSGQPVCTGGCTSGEQTERGTVKQGKTV